MEAGVNLGEERERGGRLEGVRPAGQVFGRRHGAGSLGGAGSPFAVGVVALAERPEGRRGTHAGRVVEGRGLLMSPVTFSPRAVGGVRGVRAGARGRSDGSGVENLYHSLIKHISGSVKGDWFLNESFYFQ